MFAGLPLSPKFADAATSEAGLGAVSLASFHAGDRAVLQACYVNHFATVQRAIRGILEEVDQETLIHELFARLIADPELRRAFQGGSLGAWLATVARNQAIDYRRRIGRECSLGELDSAAPVSDDWQDQAHARLLIEQFRRDHLPAEWQGVFELRFLKQLPQRAAARQLGIQRTTLAYRELRIRRLLKHFVNEGGEP